MCTRGALHREERAAEVHVDHAVPLFGRHVEERPDAGDAGVDEPVVQTAEAFVHRRHSAASIDASSATSHAMLEPRRAVGREVERRDRDPALLQALATAAPMPEAPPVTTAVVPSSSSTA